MVERILFPTDGSAGAMSTLEHALDLAADHDAGVHILTVDGGGGEPPGREVLELATDRVRDRGLEVETTLREGRPYREILDLAEEAGIDLIVMPTHGRTGLERLLLGSVTARVMRLADVPVLTACPDAELRYPYRRVLVPTDGSQCAAAALDVGVELAETANVPLSALSVVETPGSDGNVHPSGERERRENLAERAVESAASTARGRVSEVSTAVVGGRSIPATIREHAAEERADLIVLGTHGRAGLDRYLFGGVTEKLVRTSDVPVLTVREPEGE
ncbi:universal stress protein [Halorhabdus amylolytica]|uniref:universal stress protein n=1 Tax=Halorhabdus amylolytica TaxID=2559573 RepID=UPI0010A9DE3F|nr:universal stress protein [Halorhabdus amylolytica]